MEEDERINLSNWFKGKFFLMDNGRREVSAWIDRVHNDGNIAPEDNASRVGSQASSMKSKASSLRSGTSSVRSKASSEARIRLAEEKARLLSKEILEKDMETVNKIRMEAKRRAQIAHNRAEWIRISSVERALDGMDGLGSSCSRRNQETSLKGDGDKAPQKPLIDFAHTKPKEIIQELVGYTSKRPALCPQGQSKKLNRSLPPRESLPTTHGPKEYPAVAESSNGPGLTYDQRSPPSEQIALLAEIAQRSHLPKSEPEVFDGIFDDRSKRAGGIETAPDRGRTHLGPVCFQTSSGMGSERALIYNEGRPLRTDEFCPYSKE